MRWATRLLHTGHEMDPATGALSVPVYQVSSFHQFSPGQEQEYDYSRSGNPTRKALEETMADLEGGGHGFAFASGMAAISSVLCLFSQGDHIIAGEDIYGGTYRVLTRLFPRFGFDVSFVDTADLEKLTAAFYPHTRAVYLETPSNPLMRITDLRAVAELAHARGALVVVDNTVMTPYFQRPLELGADIVVHSATKYLAGHSDVIAGVAVVREAGLARELGFIQNAFGAVLGPQDSWLVLRGAKTLKVRMEQHQTGAMAVAAWLAGRPEVEEVYYPGLSSHPGHELHFSQASGASGLLSFRLVTAESAQQVLARSRLPFRAVSLGSVESLISMPARMSHASLAEEHRHRLGIDSRLLRYSVGLEEPEDIIADLEAALRGEDRGR
ncbi:MAG: PLP-dependent transferase [Clostridia bacterium]|nr:MAG: PLP-dependent transferase [Clostridia bacterium]